MTRRLITCHWLPESRLNQEGRKPPRTIVIKFPGSVLSVGTIKYGSDSNGSHSLGLGEMSCLISVLVPLDGKIQWFSITGVNGFSDTISFGVGFLWWETLLEPALRVRLTLRRDQEQNWSKRRYKRQFLFDLNGDGVVDSKDFGNCKNNAARSIP